MTSPNAGKTLMKVGLISSIRPVPVLSVTFVPRRHKIVILIAIASICLAYRFLRSEVKVSDETCIIDRVMEVTRQVNNKINKQNSFGYKMEIIAQQIIDIQFILFLLLWIVRLQTFEMASFMGLFYSLRALFLDTVKFPFPQGHFWQQPPVPSLIVPYGKSRDFFYSGHTGFMVFAVLIWLKTRYLGLILFTVFGMVFVVLTLVCTRVHYTCDIFTGWVSALEIYYFIETYMRQVDRVFSGPFSLGRHLYRRWKKV